MVAREDVKSSWGVWEQVSMPNRSMVRQAFLTLFVSYAGGGKLPAFPNLPLRPRGLEERLPAAERVCSDASGPAAAWQKSPAKRQIGLANFPTSATLWMEPAATEIHEAKGAGSGWVGPRKSGWVAQNPLPKRFTIFENHIGKYTAEEFF